MKLKLPWAVFAQAWDQNHIWKGAVNVYSYTIPKEGDQTFLRANDTAQSTKIPMPAIQPDCHPSLSNTEEEEGGGGGEEKATTSRIDHRIYRPHKNDRK